MFHSQEEFLVCSATPQLLCLRGSEHQLAPVRLLSSPLLNITWNIHWLLKVFPHGCIHMGVALEFKGNRSFLKFYQEHFPGQITVDTRQASWSQQVGMAALSQVQPARLQSFVSTSPNMLTSRDSHLKIMIQIVVFCCSRKNVALQSLPHLDATPEVPSSSTGHTNCRQQHSLLLVCGRSPAEFLKSRLSVWLFTGFN